MAELGFQSFPSAPDGVGLPEHWQCVLGSTPSHEEQYQTFDYSPAGERADQRGLDVGENPNPANVVCDSVRALLFIDIEGSTPLVQRLGARYAQLITRYDRVVRDAVARCQGEVVTAEGDGYFILFAGVDHGLGAALDMQRAVSSEPWPDAVDVRVRMGLHIGDVIATAAGPVGLAIHHAARIAAAARGGQVLVSARAAEAADDVPPGCALKTLGVHELRDVGPIELYQLTHSALAADFPPVQSVTTGRHNLPAPKTSMIGRSAESEAVHALLNAHRLVTLVGAGGCGKTRLALRVAADRIARHVDGVRLVELAALTERGAVGPAIAAALGAEPDKTSPDDLVALLHDREMLIVLDNCEHVLDACVALVADLLGRCARLSFLTASREPIGVAGEAVYRVPSLQPEEAVRLFVDRVRLGRPGYEPTPEDAHAIGEICKRLDGLPLAIELAAARGRVLSPLDIAARLDDRFRLLTGGARDALPRQRTLVATIDWSYQLLMEEERVLLAQLAVFQGGATLDAVQAVCASGTLDAGAVLDLVTSLVEKSLVTLDDAATVRRVSLPETIRQYATDRLLDRPDVAALRDAHAAWFGSLLATLGIGPSPYRRAMRAALAREDQDNLSVALEWATARGSTDALRVIGILAADYAEIREPDAFHERIEAALSAAPDAPASLRALAIARLAWELLERGLVSRERAVALCSEAIALAAPTGDHRAMVEVGLWAGYVQLTRTESTKIGLATIAVADASQDPWLSLSARVETLNFCAVSDRGSIAEDAEAIAVRIGADEFRGLIALSIADTAADRGDGARALAVLDDAMQFDAAAAPVDRWMYRTYGGVIVADQGEFARAEALLADGLTLAERGAHPTLERQSRGALAHLARLRSDGATARRQAELAVSERQLVRLTDALALLAGSAAARLAGDAVEAAGWLLPILRSPDTRADILAQALEELSACLSALDLTDDAAAVFGTARQWRQSHNAPAAPARRAAIDELSCLGNAASMTIEAAVALAEALIAAR